MNPFTNRWSALLVVVGVLLIVSELVGTAENGGVLSQAAGTSSADGEQLPPGVVVVPPLETSPEDEPQTVMPDSPDVVDSDENPIDEPLDGDPDQDAPDESYVDDGEGVIEDFGD